MVAFKKLVVLTPDKLRNITDKAYSTSKFRIRLHGMMRQRFDSIKRQIQTVCASTQLCFDIQLLKITPNWGGKRSISRLENLHHRMVRLTGLTWWSKKWRQSEPTTNQTTSGGLCEQSGIVLAVKSPKLPWCELIGKGSLTNCSASAFRCYLQEPEHQLHYV